MPETAGLVADALNKAHNVLAVIAYPDYTSEPSDTLQRGDVDRALRSVIRAEQALEAEKGGN